MTKGDEHGREYDVYEGWGLLHFRAALVPLVLVPFLLSFDRLCNKG